ncbi:MAG: branched-chain amino acid ABC transporter permease [Desulfitobacteriaceae bacterium]
MQLWLQIILNGILQGGILGISALAFSLQWGVMNLINLAHGSFQILAAYLAIVILERLGLDPFLAMPIIFLVFFAGGYLIQFLIINRVISGNLFMILLLTFGMDFVLANVMILLFTADYKSLNTPYANSSWHFLGLQFPIVRTLALVFLIVLSVLLWLLLEYSWTGRAIRATSMGTEPARLMGLNIPKVYALTFGLSTGLAGIAGVFFGLSNAFSPASGGPLTVGAFVVTILGGVGTSWGPLVGGLILGVLDAVGSVILGPTYVNVITFGLLLVILILRPTGILGRAT